MKTLGECLEEDIWTQTEFEVKTPRIKKMIVIHNMSNDNNSNSIQHAFENWMARTDTYTVDSFCQYILSKGCHFAFPLKIWKQNFGKPIIKKS